MTSRIAATLLPLVTSSIAFAHPGHGVDGGNGSPAHFLTEPIHIVPALFLLVSVTLLTFFACKWLSSLRVRAAQVISTKSCARR